MSKWFLVLGALEAHKIPFLVVLLVSSFLNAAYFMPIVYKAFFSAPQDSDFLKGIQEAPPFCLIPLLVTALVSIALLVYPQPFFKLAQMAVQGIMGTP